MPEDEDREWELLERAAEMSADISIKHGYDVLAMITPKKLEEQSI